LPSATQRQMPRLSRGWPSRPPCQRPASQGGKTR